MTTSRLLRNAVSPGWESLRDILLEDGRIKAVGEKLEAPENGAIDLAGRVVIPGLVDGHTHLDKALSLDLCENPEGTLLGAISGDGRIQAVDDRSRRFTGAPNGACKCSFPTARRLSGRTWT